MIQAASTYDKRRDVWRVTLTDTKNGKTRTVTVRRLAVIVQALRDPDFGLAWLMHPHDGRTWKNETHPQR